MPKVTKIFDKATILSTLKELPSETKVRHWILQTDKNVFYSVVYFFMPRLGFQWSIFSSDKKGKRKSQKPIVTWPATSMKEIGEVSEKFIDEFVKFPENVA
jgi:hypothetical protein